jgi:hypothetical protein
MKKLFELQTHVWIAGMLNAFLLADQLRIVYGTRQVSGLSLFMWSGFIYMQTVMAIAGWRAKPRLWGQAVGLGASALISATIVTLILLWG